MKYKKTLKGSTGQAAKKYKKWPWGDHMSFLDDTIASRSTFTNIDETEEQTSLQSPPNLNDCESTNEREPATSPPPQSSSFFSTPATSKSKLLTQSKDKKRKQGADDVDKVISYLENKKRQSYDSIDHLFLSYAETFKTFSKKKQATLKIKLATFFAEAEVDEFTDQEQIRSLSVASSRSSCSQIDITNCDDSSQCSNRCAANNTTTLHVDSTKPSTSSSYRESESYLNILNIDRHSAPIPNRSPMPPDHSSTQRSAHTNIDNQSLEYSNSFSDVRQMYEKSYQFLF